MAEPTKRAAAELVEAKAGLLNSKNKRWLSLSKPKRACIANKAAAAFDKLRQRLVGD